MRKILFLICAVVFAASCKMDGGYAVDYELCTTFEFQNVSYTEEFGSDSTYFDAVGKTGIVWSDIAFLHKISDNGVFQGGFQLSYLKAAGLNQKEKDHEPNNYKVAGEPLSARNNTYAVFYQNKDYSLMPANDVKFLYPEIGTCTISHCWINNTEAVYEAAKKFENGDKLTLTATGYFGGFPTASTSINLARPDSVIVSWTKFNLSKLGVIDAIDFELSASRSDIPTYFCLDELTGKISLEY